MPPHKAERCLDSRWRSKEMPRRRFMRRSILVGMVCVAAGVATSGCTVHPAGEAVERQAAMQAGRAYERRAGEELAPLNERATVRELVRYALATSATVEQRYWEWRAAIEQIPQD